jgi:hypothetical protein
MGFLLTSVFTMQVLSVFEHESSFCWDVFILHILITSTFVMLGILSRNTVVTPTVVTHFQIVG